jgi:hypothetical protein
LFDQLRALFGAWAADQVDTSIYRVFGEVEVAG